jgi:hypothetical protein
LILGTGKPKAKVHCQNDTAVNKRGVGKYEPNYPWAEFRPVHFINGSFNGEQVTVNVE